MLCTSKVHPFSLSLENYLGTSLTIGNLTRIRVTSADGHGQGQSSLLPSMLLNVMPLCCLVSYQRTLLYFGVTKISNFQKLIGNFDKMTVANLGRQHQRPLDFYFKSFGEYLNLFGVTSYYFIPSIFLKIIIYIYYKTSYYLCFRITCIIRQLYAICHIKGEDDTSITRLVLCFPNVSY